MGDGSYDGIAIIGMAGRFPGAETIEEFWANLIAGRETVSVFSDAELAESGLDADALRRRGRYIAARGILKDADCFDAAFFGIHPKEAEVMDPQQRVFIETCWTALERAGYAPNRTPGSVGVFAGVTFNTYYLHALHKRPDLLELVGPEQVMFGNEKDYVATRVAYKLGLKGPALNVSTACSTSLVAVGQACQSLLLHQCDVALAGAASVTVPQKRGYFYDEGNIGSSDGHTRPFDAQAAGTTFGNGVAVVVLKRLEDAVNDGDRVWAVIKGAALNNDGSQRVSFGAPGVEGQSEVIAMAHALAGVDPDTITYVEAHGTATPLGDPIEVAGLTKAFRLGTDARQFCAIGSVKSNLGHLDVAAGATGLIKTALALHHRVLPASLHFTKANPKLDLEHSPFYVNASLQEWRTKPGVPRRAGVSSFGTGGTNAHVVLEEAPELEPSGASRPWQLLVLSAKTPEALDRTTASVAGHLKQLAGDIDAAAAARELADAAFTLQTGRSEFVHRRIVVCSDAADGAAALETRDAKRVFTHHQQLREPPVVFMFPGQGAQYAGMGAALYRTESAFRGEVDRCAELLQPILHADLRDVMFPAPGAEKEADEQLLQTQLTQPALFTIEYALAKLWMSWGVRPAAMIGHSVGEYVAGCLAEVFTLEDALTLVARRRALVQAQPGGAMLAVRLPENDVQPLLDGRCAIAAVNSPNLCVVAGAYDAIEQLEKQLASRGIVARRLHTSHAFHSPMMDPVLAPFTELLRSVKLGEPKIPYVSNVTANWIASAEATSPEYWAGHVRQTVRFADGVAQLMKDARNILLEVGPGQTLTTLARQNPAKSSDQLVLATLPLSGAEEPRGLLETLGRLWMSGLTVDWKRFYQHEHRRRTVLPTYPFERKRFWPEPAAVAVHDASVVRTVAASGSPQPETTTNRAPSGVPQLEIASPVRVEPAVPRRERLLAAARALLQELSGYDLSGVDPTVGLLELGLDSLLLTQASQLFQRRFGVSITFRQLMEELGSLEDIAAHLDAKLPPDAPAPTAPAVPTAVVAMPVAGSQEALLQQIWQQQQQIANQLLQMMGRQPAPSPAALASPVATPAPLAAMPPPKQDRPHGPFKPIDRSAGSAMTPKQRATLDEWIARYTRRTAGSKKLASENRPILADPRSVAGFNRLWKEMVYPIATTRSDGSRVWDVDGNEYIDFVMGFGASLFGHRPPFVVEAVREQLERGFEIGPIQPLAGEVAALLREFTGLERFGFTNTGSEAVLAATRVARTVTGRDKIAIFASAYHGIFDEVLFRSFTAGGETRTAPIAPGIPESAVSQVIVLDYGNPQSLEILQAHSAEIAAVLVEPVQSRRLELQPREFLLALRQVTEQAGIALIFDEVVTGFRVDQGGAQAYFGVRADLATYGKVIGGGLPIGVVAGEARFMDALDGGKWQYGDTSFPEIGVTFFAGTFVRHPLALAAAKAVLTHLKHEGPELQRRLTARTERAANELRTVLEEFQAPYHLTQFSSLMHLTSPPDQKFAGLLYYLLRERGIHTWENRLFIATTAHTDDDYAALARALRESLAEMRAGEMLLSPTGVKAAPAPARAERAAAAAIGDADTIPLTEAQKEIWLAAQMGGSASVAYNESLKLEFRGALDVEVFRAAVQQIVQRHPLLLASITGDGEYQRLPRERTLDVPVVDCSGRSEAERVHALEQLLDSEVSEPFDLAVGPLLRVKVARLSDDHFVALWTAHHVVCDGWSGSLVVSELAAIYSALKQGIAADLPVPVAFRDYALEAREQAESPDGLKAAEYWRLQYADTPPPLELPTDRARPVRRSARADTLKWHFDASVHQGVKRVAGQQRTTLVVLLMATFKTLLHRLTGQTDLVVGLGIAGQAVSGKNCLVGHCLNLLPVRTQLNSDASFKANLAAVKKSVLDAYDHHQSTIGGLLQQIQVRRSAGRQPLVEVIVNVDQDLGAAQFHGLQFSCEQNAKKALHFDLFFNFVEGTRGLHLECSYNTDLFDRSTIQRWMRHFQTLVESIIADAGETLGKLVLLTEAERRELTVGWNHTGVEFPKEQTLYERFEQQVEKTPDARAVTFEGRHLTYRELNRHANQLARHLRKLGVGPDVLVALFAERSIEMVVGILGILKAGGAYLPIDPIYPKERVAFMLEDANAPILLTQSALQDELPTHKMKVLCFDTDTKLFDSEQDTNLDRSSTPEDLAYVIYTSGSTGRPKGTLITHYNVMRLMQSTDHWYQFNERDVWTFFHSHAFDFSVWELFGALLYGGRVVIVPQLISRSPKEFYELLVNERVTVLNQTPSAFKQLIQAEGQLGASGGLALRYVIFGGEALEMHSLKPWFDRHGDRQPRLVNMYGITETTVHVTYRPLSSEDLNASKSVIGVPIPDLQLYILDSYRQPVPIGVAGEIYVGGAGVARGYLKREELTRERFLPDPFTEKSGALLYRSGDHARFLPTRDIEYLGRIDSQVKLRGFRIELGEIEAALRHHEAVKECVAIAREDVPGEKVIVGYIEPKSGTTPAANDLRAHLKKTLPDYMVPSTFVSMDRWPLTANGKIDRKALPPPDEGRIDLQRDLVEPRDPLEQMLARIWRRVLKTNRVGVHDNFFELGGHSLLAVRIIVEIEKLSRKRLPLATLLQAPTIAELAEVLRRENWEPSWSSLVGIRPEGSRPPLFLMHSHGGNVMEYYPLVNCLDGDLPVFALQARGLDGRIIRNQSLEEMAAFYLQEMRSVQPDGPYYLGGFCFGGLLALEAAQQLRAAGQEVALVAMIQTAHPGCDRLSSSTKKVRRLWERATKRIDLEQENLADRGKDYFYDRFRYVWDKSVARARIAFDSMAGNGNRAHTTLSTNYILESLGIEHDRIFDRYEPRPYDGDVLLIRASKQLRTLAGDPSLGWKKALRGSVELCEVSGHQQNILTEPRVSHVAEQLTAGLRAAQRRFDVKV